MVSRTDPGAVHAVQYEPPPDYELDVELYRGEELHRRAQPIQGRIERIDFHVLLYLTRGGYTHMLDFDEVRCEAGSLVLLRPGQVHRFGDTRRFVGWVLVFRAEILPPRTGGDGLDLSAQLEELPSHVRLPAADRQAIDEVLERMASDAERDPSPALNTLMISQLTSLLLRLRLASLVPGAAPVDRAVLQRFRRFRAAVEREHRRWHLVRQYAKHLGCSTKSLNRAARAVSDTTAKAFIADRVVLEAKRLLVHTAEPVFAISTDLGFEESTNFVKFFRHQTGVTPGAFRQRHGGS